MVRPGEIRPVRIAAGGISGQKIAAYQELYHRVQCRPAICSQSLQQQRADLSVERHGSPDDRDDTRRPYRAFIRVVGRFAAAER